MLWYLLEMAVVTCRFTQHALPYALQLLHTTYAARLLPAALRRLSVVLCSAYVYDSRTAVVGPPVL